MRRSILATALALTACVPMLEGPQLMRNLPGLGYVPNQHGVQGIPFRDHAIVESRFWASPGEPVSTLNLTGYRGEFDETDVEAWRTLMKSGGTVGLATIDGRKSWIWFVPDDWHPACTAIVPYPDETFVIVLTAGRVEHRDEALMRRAVQSFARTPGSSSKWLVPVVTAALVALAGLLFWKLRHEKPPERRPVVSRPAPPPPSPLRR